MAYNTVKNYSLIAVVLIILCLVTGYFLLNTTYPDLQQAKALKMRNEQTNADLKEALASEQTFLKVYQSQADNVTKADLILPTGSPDMANFVTNLSTLSTASGVTLSNFAVSDDSTQQKNSTNSIGYQDLNFSASGSYPSLRNFILSLENSSRLVDISNIVLSADQTAGPATAIQYQFKLHTYFQN